MTMIGGQQTRAVAGRDAPAQRLEVNVIFTNQQATLCAVREAARLTAGLQARIRVVAPSIVPYPLPVTEPPVSEVHQRRCLRAIAGRTKVEMTAEILLCRDYGDLTQALPPESVVILAGKRRWWRPWDNEQRLRRALTKSRRHVIFIDIRSIARA